LSNFSTLWMFLPGFFHQSFMSNLRERCIKNSNKNLFNLFSVPFQIMTDYGSRFHVKERLYYWVTISRCRYKNASNLKVRMIDRTEKYRIPLFDGTNFDNWKFRNETSEWNEFAWISGKFIMKIYGNSCGSILWSCGSQEGNYQ